MKKIIMAFDGEHFSPGVFKFANRLNANESILATGVFLPVVDYAELLYSFGTISGPIYVSDIWDNDGAIVENSIDAFRKLCKTNGIKYKVHPDLERHIVTELQTESRYADLLLLSSEEFYVNLGKARQEDYLKEVLHKVECPVVLLPEDYKFPESIILAFDGSEASTFAIKQFAYLFPQLTDLKTILVYASDTEAMPCFDLIKELTRCHFKNISYYKLDAEKKYFDTWLVDNKSPMLVAGAFERSLLSEFIRKSFIIETIRDHKLPIFIAHR